MKLHVALEIYAVEGPYHLGSTEHLATRVVHAHLDPGELRALTRLWETRATTRGEFLQKLEQVKTRLRSMGFI